VTHLRQKMLDELQRRNYSQNTVYTYLHAEKSFLGIFTARQTGWDLIISGSIRPICFENASFKQGR
jgi:hypothetical protein